MDIDQAEIDTLVASPAETRDLEIKAWIDPRTPEGKTKLLRALLALRNFNGGRLVIGFHNDTLQPLAAEPADILDAYHNDNIQGLVSKHSSETFDVAVGFGQREGQRHPVIVVASGIRTPVAVKVPVTEPNGSQVLKKGSIFFRSLQANGTVSSAEAQPADWPEIMQICMDNREADIGRFVRRHLAGLDVTQIAGALSFLQSTDEAQPTLSELARSWLDEGAARAVAAVSRWPSQPYPGDRPNISELLRVGAWEVALVIDPPISGRVADNAFYQTVASSIPSYSGWPIWLGTRSHNNPVNRHSQVADGWEAFIVSVLGGMWDHVEFQRWEPAGRFYLRRLHDDDASAKVRVASPGRILDLGRVASRVAESMIVGLAVAKALGCAEDLTQLGFAFRWTGIEGRIPAFWASGLRYFPAEQRSLDTEATTFVPIPLATAPSAVTPFVAEATRSLFAKFDGFAMSNDVLERCVQMVFDRRT